MRLIHNVSFTPAELECKSRSYLAGSLLYLFWPPLDGRTTDKRLAEMLQR
jgi:hypothetical protein